MLKIAITGNIASGKSIVEKKISDKGFCVYDADIIAHEVLEEIKDFFGYDVFSNGKIDRKKLGKLVFENIEIREKLEKIVHPQVRKKIIEIFEKHKTDKFIFISVPLLFEAKFTDLFDKILFISCPEEIRLKRLMARNNLSEKEALLRINSQMAESNKIPLSDFVIINDSDIQSLDIQVNSFCAQYLF